MSSKSDVPKKKPRPRLTARSAAEMMDAPAGEMAKLLKDQKYPHTGDRVFRTPYYQPAISGMVHYFKDGKAALRDARAKFQSFRVPSRRENCERALQSFEKSQLSGRKLIPKPNRRFSISIGDVELRLSPDLQANENGELRVIYFNCKVGAYRPEVAHRLLEIAYVILSRNGMQVRPDQIEFCDLFTGYVHTITKVRESTLRMLDDEAAMIVKVWSEV